MRDEDRPFPAAQGDERAVLTGFLAFHRATLEWKISDLPEAGWTATLAPSSMTLVGLVKHLWFVEDWWAKTVLAGHPEVAPWASVDWSADPDWDWHSAVNDDPAEVVAAWKRSCAEADAIYAGVAMDDLQKRVREGAEPVNARWILTHMIEEYSRHNGHADLLRESIDGRTGE